LSKKGKSFFAQLISELDQYPRKKRKMCPNFSLVRTQETKRGKGLGREGGKRVSWYIIDVGIQGEKKITVFLPLAGTVRKEKKKKGFI